MAARVARLLNTTEESWLKMQIAIDLCDVQREAERFTDIVPIEHWAA